MSGEVLFTGQDIRDGQNVWQSLGGQELGSIWGHGAYVAPDWSADWLHRECVWLLNHWSEKDHGKTICDLASVTASRIAVSAYETRFVRTRSTRHETKSLCRQIGRPPSTQWAATMRPSSAMPSSSQPMSPISRMAE